jgi:ATP-dependent Lon protease
MDTLTSYVFNDDLTSLKLYINESNINSKDQFGITLLMYACGCNKLDIVKYLLDNFADPTLQSNVGETALDFSIQSGNIDIINLIKNYKFKVSTIPKHVQDDIKLKSKSLNSKDKEYANTLLSIPFNKYSYIQYSSVEEVFDNAKTILNSVCYGMDNVKEELIDILALQLSNPLSHSRVIGLKGPPGVGKTSIIKKGLSMVLNRGFVNINMGGLYDSSYLIGHDYSYISSKPGIIINGLISTGTMNPIYFFDEVDKVSNTDKGKELINVLIHLTDPLQNTEFTDRYFQGVKFDLSRALFVFCFNNEELIDPILLDRMHIININTPSIDEKVVIGKKYLLKEIIDNINISNIDIEENALKFLIKNYIKDDSGLRGLRKSLESIVFKINTAKYTSTRYKSLKNIRELEKIYITKEMIEEILVKTENNWISNMYI